MGEIAKLFPKADHFYDLFGGGFSATHYMLVNRRKSFKQFHYNELRSGMCELISDAIKGKYNYKVFKPDWISRERFFAEKETNAYIKIIWSFGNNGDSYLFGKDLEEHKRSMHMAVVFDEFDSWFIDTFGIKKWPLGLGIKARRLFLKTILRHKMGQRVDLEQLQQLERLQQLQQLEQLQRLEKLNFYSTDYREVPILPNSIVYCDIPYKGTGGYLTEFSHKDFFDWAATRDFPVFISEYNIADPRFKLIYKVAKTVKMSPQGQTKENTDLHREKLYWNGVSLK